MTPYASSLVVNGHPSILLAEFVQSPEPVEGPNGLDRVYQSLWVGPGMSECENCPRTANSYTVSLEGGTTDGSTV